jgi:hypothetical protein
VAKGNELAERFVNTSKLLPVSCSAWEGALTDTRPDLYHVYADASNFFYEIVLTRDDAEAGWQGQKYILYVSSGPSAGSNLLAYS